MIHSELNIPKDRKVMVCLEERGLPDSCLFLREEAEDIVFLTTRERGMGGWRTMEVYIPKLMIRRIEGDVIDLDHHSNNVRYQTLISQGESKRYEERARLAGLRVG